MAVISSSLFAGMPPRACKLPVPQTGKPSFACKRPVTNERGRLLWRISVADQHCRNAAASNWKRCEGVRFAGEAKQAKVVQRRASCAFRVAPHGVSMHMQMHMARNSQERRIRVLRCCATVLNGRCISGKRASGYAAWSADAVTNGRSRR